MIIYVDMVADLFHSGHINFLSQIKSLYPDSQLIVGLMSDQEAVAYKRQPILTLEERTQIVRACRYVDLVIPGAPMPINSQLLDHYQIDLVIHGDDITPANREYWYGVAIKDGKYLEIPYTRGISTTDIINRIIQSSKGSF